MAFVSVMTVTPISGHTVLKTPSLPRGTVLAAVNGEPSRKLLESTTADARTASVDGSQTRNTVLDTKKTRGYGFSSPIHWRTTLFEQHV